MSLKQAVAAYLAKVASDRPVPYAEIKAALPLLLAGRSWKTSLARAIAKLGRDGQFSTVKTWQGVIAKPGPTYDPAISADCFGPISLTPPNLIDMSTISTFEREEEKASPFFPPCTPLSTPLPKEEEKPITKKVNPKANPSTIVQYAMSIKSQHEQKEADQDLTPKSENFIQKEKKCAASPSLDLVLAFASSWLGTPGTPSPIEPGFAEWWHATVDNSTRQSWDSMKCWKIGLITAWRGRCRRLTGQVTGQVYKPSKAAQWRQTKLKVEAAELALERHHANPRHGNAITKEQWADYVAQASNMKNLQQQLTTLNEP